MKVYNTNKTVKACVIVGPGGREADGGETATTEDQG